MSRSITRRLIAYFVAVLLIFALLTAGIYILIFRRAVMSEARENLFDRGDRIAHLLVNWSFDDSDIDFCPDETDPATAEDSSPRPSRGRWGDGAGKGNATTSQGQGTGNVSSPGKGKQESAAFVNTVSERIAS
jgi:hypothetical protein